MVLKMKRIYDEANDADGYRILVDRLWPRGITKEKAKIDYWAKEITPSTEIRRTFKHETERFEAFRNAYLYELNNNVHAVAFLAVINEKLKMSDVTLLYAARDEKINHVVVLKDWIEQNS
ncbi:MAG: DUF488 domain-containing protein [Acidaminococcaceae bacterium]